MTAISEHIDRLWADDITPTIERYIEIPNVSASYDGDWEAHGYMEEAVQLVRQWCAARPIDGLTVDVHRIPGRTPLILAEVPASDPALAERTVLLYGHLDKQPEMTGWRDGLGPWLPVIEGDRLYGRGGADDGYAAFAALSAIEVAQAHGLAHGRLVVLIEASEESGSPDLPEHVQRLGDVIGRPELVICLDSGAADTQRLWVTTSLRGLVHCNMTAEVLTEGVHSGVASGIVPSSFRVIRQLLDRIEDAATGRVLLAEAHVDIPADRLARDRRDCGGGGRVTRRRASVCRFDTADVRRSAGADPLPHVAPRVELRRRRRIPTDESCRKRVAPVHDAGAEPATPADMRSTSSPRRAGTSLDR